MDDLEPPSQKKILIIRFSSIGDIVLTTPVIRCLKKRLPETEIHFLIKQEFSHLLDENPYINRVHLFRGNLKETIRMLRSEKFDFVVDLQRNYRSFRIKNALHAPHKTFPKLNFKKWIRVNLKLNLLPDIHIVDRYFKAVTPLNVTNDLQGLDFIIPENKTFDIDDLPAVFEDGYVAISIGAKHFTKRISPQKVVEIGRGLYKPVLLLGGRDVADVGDEIEEQLGERAYNGCGKFSLQETASLIKESDGLITGDTGLMHIAAALHKPIAAVWGNTIPEFGMYPYMPEERNLFRLFEITDLKCRPCSKLGFDKCPMKHFDCMERIPSIEVADWINSFSDD